MTISKKEIDSYDEIKGMLNKIRKIQAMPKYGMIQEQTYQGETSGNSQPIPQSTNNTNSENSTDEDVAVINNVDVEVHSEDPEERKLEDDEKGTISQLIDDFKAEVSEMADFDGLHIYPENAVLNGKIGGKNISFSFSAGDDNGFYLGSPSLLKIDDETLDLINKLKTFEVKFENTINDLLSNRRNM
jgi:hypothetical protein